MLLPGTLSEAKKALTVVRFGTISELEARLHEEIRVKSVRLALNGLRFTESEISGSAEATDKVIAEAKNSIRQGAVFLRVLPRSRMNLFPLKVVSAERVISLLDRIPVQCFTQAR